MAAPGNPTDPGMCEADAEAPTIAWAAPSHPECSGGVKLLCSAVGDAPRLVGEACCAEPTPAGAHVLTQPPTDADSQPVPAAAAPALPQVRSSRPALVGEATAGPTPVRPHPPPPMPEEAA